MVRTGVSATGSVADALDSRTLRDWDVRKETQVTPSPAELFAFGEAGHSYVVMLDGHVEKVTVSGQLRRSRRPAGMGECRLGPGGSLALAWPVNVPPPGGWENQ